MDYGDKTKQFLDQINQCHSISKAAMRLYVTQPYISQTIHKLEKDLGVALIQHQYQGTQLTYAGKRLLDYLKDQDENYIRMREEMKKIAHYQNGVLRMGFNQPIGHYLIPAILPKFRKAYPDLQIILTEMSTDKGAYLLENGQLDVFYGMYIKKKNLVYMPVADEPYYVVVSNQDNKASINKEKNISLLTDSTILNDKKLISIPADSRFQQQVDRYLSKNQIKVKRSIVVPDLDLAANLVHYQEGITFSAQGILQKQHLFNDPLVDIFQIPLASMRIDSGISFKSNDNPTVNLMMSLMIAQLRKEQQKMPEIIN